MGDLPVESMYRVLESVLRPLAYWYNQDNVEDVAVNNPGGIWLRLRGRHAHPWHFYEDPKLTREYLINLLHIIANSYNMAFDPVNGNPVVFTQLPGGHRFTGIAGQNVQYDNNDLTGGVALDIRIWRPDQPIKMKEFGLEEGERLQRINKLKGVEDPDDPYDRLVMYIKRGNHILVSGGTATGKTTFLNNMIQLLDLHKRVVTVEDVRELKVPHKNRVHIVLSRTEQTNAFDYKKVIDLAVRFTPDAILCGEISTSNAAAFWELMNTGHDNCFATIHADSAFEAYQAFLSRILHSSPGLDREKTLKEMRDKVKVVQINRDGNIRAVTEIT